MKDIDEFMQGIAPYAPGCAAPTAYFGIRQAAIEFCARTRLWRHKASVAITANTAAVIPVPTDAVLHRFERVLFDGQPLDPKTPAWLDENAHGWRDGELEGQPAYVTQLEPGTMLLVPGADGTASVSISLKPSQSAMELPDFMVNEYRSVICTGALAHILAIPGQPFTNVNLAMTYAQGFQAQVDSLATIAQSGQQGGRTRTKAQFM